MPHKRVTMQQVADQAGVSRTTVSFVLNNTPNVNIPAETRARVWQAAAELNYARDFAAHSLATGRSHTIAFILRQRPEELLVNAFVGGLLGGVNQAIYKQNYRILFEAVGHETEQNVYTTLIRSQRVDGLLISGPIIRDTELLKLHREHVPLVIQGSPDNQQLYAVDIDNAASARTVVEHLINLGHRHIAHITNGPLSYTASRDRLSGYQAALEAAHIPIEPAYININHSFTDEGGYRAMQALLAQSPRPTAVFAGSDVVALGAMRAIHEAGLSIPADISLAGFDDIPFARYLIPGLTTIRIPVIDLGKQAGKMLMQLIKRERPPKKHVLLNTELIIRESTSQPHH